MKKNACIIHFNTPELTACLIRSINKHTPGVHIYLFDNSNKYPFKEKFENVTVFDNTRGQIINFNTWLEKYPNKTKSNGKANNWGSAKHAYSVEKCMELIKEPFVLFDSDVLVKKDITPLFDEIVCYKGEVIVQPGSTIKRVLPYICFINTPLCKEKRIHYFDENYMHGLRYKGNSDSYDTGAALYILTGQKKGLHREIKTSDYVVHYGNGSWVVAAEKMKKPKHIPAQDWLNKYKNLRKKKKIEREKKEAIDRKIINTFNHIFYLYSYQKDIKNFNILKEKLTKENKYQPSDVFKKIYNASQDDVKRYEILKEAKSLGYKNILLIEEPAVFIKNEEAIKKLFSNIPDDADIVLFDKMVPANTVEILRYKNYVKKISTGAMFGKKKDINVPFSDSSCFYLNEKTINKLLELQKEKILKKSDILNNTSLNIYFSVENAAITDGHDKDYERIGIDIWKYKDKPEILKQNKPAENRMIVKNTAKLTRQNKFLAAKKTPVRESKKQDTANTSKLTMLRKKISTSNYNRLYDIM